MYKELQHISQKLESIPLLFHFYDFIDWFNHYYKANPYAKALATYFTLWHTNTK